MGWIATHDEAARKAFLSHRDYNLISCGMFDDAIASIALRHSDVMLKRNQRIVRENLAILDDWIKENPHFFYTKPKAGTTALVYYDFDIPPTSFASACTTRPVRSSRRATASSSPTACASATPATSTRSETALPR